MEPWYQGNEITTIYVWVETRQHRIGKKVKIANTTTWLKNLLNEILGSLELDCFTNVFDETMDQMDQMLQMALQNKSSELQECRRLTFEF